MAFALFCPTSSIIVLQSFKDIVVLKAQPLHSIQHIMKFLVSALLAFSFHPSLVKGGVVQLTVENFEEVTDGKNLFIKFYDPTNVHCMGMAKDWKNLGDSFADHNYTVIAEVDCTSDDSETICDDFEIRNPKDFPTLIYGDNFSHDYYEGKKDYEHMVEFANEYLDKPMCSVYHVEDCDEEQKGYIRELMEKSEEELAQMVEGIEGEVEEEERVFEKQVSDLEKVYEGLSSDFHKKTHSIKKKYNFHYIEQIMMIYQDQHLYGDVDEL